MRPSIGIRICLCVSRIGAPTYLPANVDVFAFAVPRPSTTDNNVETDLVITARTIRFDSHSRSPSIG